MQYTSLEDYMNKKKKKELEEIQKQAKQSEAGTVKYKSLEDYSNQKEIQYVKPTTEKIAQNKTDERVRQASIDERNNSWWGKFYDWMTKEPETSSTNENSFLGLFNTPESDNVLINTLATGADAATRAAVGFVLGKFGWLADISNTAIAGSEMLLGDIFNNDALKERGEAAFEGMDLIKKKINSAVNTFEKSLGIDQNSYLGDTADSVLQSVGQSYASYLTSKNFSSMGDLDVNIGGFSISLPKTSFVTGSSEGMLEAYRKGGNGGQILFGGLTGGISEMVSEGLFGTTGVGGSSIEESVSSMINIGVKNVMANKILNFGTKALGEGIEEVVSYTLNYTFDHLSDIVTEVFDDNANKMGEDWSWNEVLQNFVTGSLAGGLSAGVQSINTQIKSSRGDINAKESQEYERIRREIESKSGKSLNNAELEQLQGIVRNALEQGRTLDYTKVSNELKLNKQIREKLIEQETQKFKENYVKEKNDGTKVDDVVLSKKDIKEIESRVDEMIENGEVSSDKIVGMIGDDFDAYVEAKGKLLSQEDIDSKQEFIDKVNQQIADGQEVSTEDQTTAKKYERQLKENREFIEKNQDLFNKYNDSLNSLAGNRFNPYARSFRSIRYDTSKTENKALKGLYESINQRDIADSKSNRDTIDLVAKAIERGNIDAEIMSTQDAINEGRIMERELSDEDKQQIKELEKQLKKEKNPFKKAVIQGTINDIKYIKTNGYYNDGKITLLYDSGESIITTLGHELRHALEQSNLSEDYNALLFKYARNQHTYSKTKNDYNYLRSQIKEAYAQQLEGKSEYKQRQIIESELSAILSSKYLFTDDAFIKTLSQTDNSSLLQKIKAWFKQLKARFTGTPWASDLEVLQKTYEAMLDEVSEKRAKNEKKNKGNILYDILPIDSNRNYVYNDGSRVINESNIDNLSRATARYINNNIRNGKDVVVETKDGMPLTITRDTAYKIASRDKIKMLDGTYKLLDEELYLVKLRAGLYIDELAKTSAPPRQLSTDTKNHSFAKNGFIYRTAYYMDNDGSYYRMNISVGLNGEINSIYNLGKIKETEFPRVAQRPTSKNTGDEVLVSDGSNVSQKSQNVKSGQYSLDLDGAMVDNETGEKVELETSPIGNTGTLMAITNMSENKLNGILDLGGFPVPSIAVTDLEKVPFEQFGSYTAIFNKDTIDPINRLNEVYDRDAYTPTYPGIDYDIKNDDVWKMEETIYNNHRDSIAGVALNRYFDKENLEDGIKRYGKEGLINEAKDSKELKYLYYKTINPDFEMLTKNDESDISTYYSNQFLQEFIDEYGEIPNRFELTDEQRNDIIEAFRAKIIPYLQERANKIIAEEDAKENPRQFVKGLALSTIDTMNERLNSYGGQDNILRDLNTIQEEGTNRIVNDEAGTLNYIEENIDENAYRQWVDDTVGELVNNAEVGIWNGKDYVTDNGRRTFKQTHYPYNLENLVKVMTKGETTGGENTIGISFNKISSKQSNRFKSIEEMHNIEDRLVPSNEAYQSLQDLENSLNDNANELKRYFNDDIFGYGSAENLIFDFAGEKVKNYSTFMKNAKEYGLNNVSEKLIDKITKNLNELKNIPTDYFEAKPQRAVGLDEIATLVVPNTMSEETKQRLDEMGIPYAYYDPNIEGDRNRVENEFEQYKFSLLSVNPTTNGLTEAGDYSFAQELEDYIERNLSIKSDEPTNSTSEPTNGTPIAQKDTERHDKYANEHRKIVEQIKKKTEKMEEINRRAVIIQNEFNEFKDQFKATSPIEEWLDEEVFYKEFNQPKLKELDKLTEQMFKLQEEIDNLDHRRQELEDYMNEYPEKKTHKQIQNDLLAESGITIEDLNSAKKISPFNLNRTDPVRVAEKIFGKEIGAKINSATIDHVKHNEAERIRFLIKERDAIKDLGIKARSAESAAVQKYGEGEYVNAAGQLVNYGDAELAQEFADKTTQEKIKRAAKDIKERYRKYLRMINRAITAMGYDPIPERKDYFRHFQELNDKLSQWGIPFNPETMKSEDLPTDINGITDQFKPGKQWFASALHREGVKTTYDAITGIDGYLEGATNLIFHTKDIQRYRALSEFIKNTYGQEKGFQNAEKYKESNPKAYAEMVDRIQNNHLSSYRAWLDEQANALANKKSKLDRSVEEYLGRRAYTALNTIKQQVGSNMTGFNVRSALTNFISTTLAAGRTNKVALAKGTIATINNIFHNDGFVNKSDFLTSRFGSDRLSNKLWQKMANAGQIFMSATDNFTSNLIVRSKYEEGLMNGMTEKQAMKYADDFGARVMGDRSKGATAAIFNSKTLGVLTQFQLETNNQLDYLIHDAKMELQDISPDAKSNAIKGMVWSMGQIFAYSYFFNELFESLTGSRAAFDPIDIFKTLAGLDDDDKDKSFEERMQEANAELINTLPFTSLLGRGGRMPIGEMFEGTNLLIDYLQGKNDEYGNKIKAEDVRNQFLEDLGYLLPTGYGQIKKTKGALEMYFDENGNLRETPGSYTKSGNLRFETDTDPATVLENMIFGQWSSPEAQDYLNSGFKTLDTDQVEQMKNYGLSKNDYQTYKKGLNENKKVADKVDYIMSSDYDDATKEKMLEDVTDKDIDINEFKGYSSYDEFKFADKNPSKYKTIKTFTDYDTYQKYSDKIADIKKNTKNDKEEVIKYISELKDLTPVQKAIFIKMYYPSFKDYDNQIIEYINNSDMSYDDMESVYKELGFKVENGYVY